MKTNIRTIRLATASIALALVTAACGESITPPSPNPGGGTPPPPAPTFSVSGTISEATESGNVPLEGAWVANWATEESAITDSNGSYTLSGQRAGAAQFMVSKEGYENQMIEVMIDGDMHLDAVLVREPAESN
jgi:CarboxypepD_reg-like domain